MAKSPQGTPKSLTRRKCLRKGLIIVHTGDGKGKTTAALGMALRAAGNSMRVSITQFLKGRWKYGELRAAKQVDPEIEICQMGEGFTWITKNRQRDQEVARAAWEKCKADLNSEKYELVIFDEINYVIDYEYLALHDVLQALKEKPRQVHVILTGRNAKPELIEMADLVTEMKQVKHPFQEQGISAQKGIEY